MNADEVSRRAKEIARLLRARAWILEYGGRLSTGDWRWPGNKWGNVEITLKFAGSVAGSEDAMEEVSYAAYQKIQTLLNEALVQIEIGIVRHRDIIEGELSGLLADIKGNV